MERIAIVVSSVGYHWEELFAAHEVFAQAGASIDLYTVDGAQPKPDPLSIKKSILAPLGVGVAPQIAPDTARGTLLRNRLLEVMPLSKLDTASVDALYLPGGHGCLFDVNRNSALHGKIAELYAQGSLLSGVCHATSTFALVQVDGVSIVKGHALTGFPDPLDQTLIRVGLVHPSFLPLPLVNDQVLREAQAELSKGDVLRAMLNPRFMRISLPFITGVGPKAAAPVARAVMAALEDRASAPADLTARNPSPSDLRAGIQA